MTRASLQFNLTIMSVKTEDYGEYKLTVDNSLGDPFRFIFVLKSQGKLGNCTISHGYMIPKLRELFLKKKHFVHSKTNGMH